MQSALKNRHWLIIAFLLFAALLFLIVPYLRYRQSDGPPPRSTHLQVSILDPSHGDSLSNHSPVIVKTHAISTIPLASTELWINGELSGIQEAPLPGQSTHTTEFLWHPPDPGLYSLLARSFDQDGNNVYSTQVLLQVTAFEAEDESSVDGGSSGDGGSGGSSGSGGGGEVNDDAGKTKPASFPSGPGQPADPPNPPPSPPQSPGDDGSTVPAVEFGNFAGFFTSLTITGPPLAPNLSLSVNECTIHLSINDVSANEEGFAVYRQSDISPTWQQVALLGDQSGAQWIQYAEQVSPGTVTYYVSAFNSYGEANSNLVQTYLDPAVCPYIVVLEEPTPVNVVVEKPTPVEVVVEEPTPITVYVSEPEIITMELDGLDTTLAQADMAYCYRSLGGESWSRWPEIGFFMPNDQGFHTEGMPLNLVLKDFGGNMHTPSSDLFLECWGWTGSELQFLGELMFHGIDPENPGQYMAEENGLSAELLVKFQNVADAFQYKALSTDNIEPTMVSPVAFITQDPAVCKGHLPGGLSAAQQDALCAAYPDFPVFPSFGPTQPYLVWDFTDGCVTGSGTPPCQPYSYWLNLANQVGGQVGFSVIETNSAGNFEYQVTAPNQTAFVIPPASCTGMRTFYVQMWATGGGITVGSLHSQPVTFACSLSLIPGPLEVFPENTANGTEVVLSITFESLILSNADDGDDDSLELFGYMRATSPSMQKYRHIAEWAYQHDDCPDDVGFSSGGVAYFASLGCPQKVYNGIYDLSTQLYNCFGTHHFYCSSASNFAFQPAAMNMVVHEGDTLLLDVLFMDWDDASNNDYVCFGLINLGGPRTLAEWADTWQEPFTISTIDFGSGNCKITGTISAVTLQ